MGDLGLQLVGEGDESVTLAAMAFIDSVGTERNPNDSSSVTPKKAKRKKKITPGYSTEQARRKRAEILALQAEVRGLEGWLKHLRGSSSGSHCGSVSVSKRKANTIEQAVTKTIEEFTRLQRAESINRRLNALVANQTKVGESILAIIQQTAKPKDTTFVFGSPCQLLESYQNAGILAQLRDGARVLYTDLNAIVPQLPSTAYSSVMVPKIDPNRGKMFESSTVCTVSCSMEFAGDALWLEYSTPRKYENKSYRFMDPVGSDAVKKSFDLLLESGHGAISMNGLMFANKFEVKDRIAIVRDYVAFLPTEGLHMRCNHWTIITPFDLGCRVYFFTQLFTETIPGFSAAPQDVDYVQEIALRAWSTKMHLYSQLLHDRLEVNSL